MPLFGKGNAMTDKEPMRVLMVMTSMDRGGMETFTMNVYRAIDRSKVQFDFLLHRDFKGAYDDEIERLGGKIYHVRRQNPFDPRYWMALNKFFDHHAYRVVHVQLDCLSAEPLFAAAKHGSIVRIAHSHSSRQDRDFKYPIKLLCKPFIKYAATDLFACGYEAGKWMFGTDDFEIIRNCIDVDSCAFDPAVRTETRRELCIPVGAPVIGHVGRFVPAKNHFFLLEMFSHLLREQPEALLILVGDGPLREEAERKSKELGIEHSVKFLGVRSDVARLMQAFDCFVMPSVYEGLPMVLVEAQAAGLPCVISDSIPSDCDIYSGSIERENLDAGYEIWSERVCSVIMSQRDRSSGALAVRSAGFDSFETAHRLQDFYLSENTNFGVDVRRGR